MPETGTDLDFNCLASDRARAIDASGIRRMFELAAGLENPINLTIGQPDPRCTRGMPRGAGRCWLCAGTGRSGLGICIRLGRDGDGDAFA